MAQKPIRTVRANVADDFTDGYALLLTRVVQISVRDVRRSSDPTVVGEAWRFLWDIAPNVAERLFDETEGVVAGKVARLIDVLKTAGLKVSRGAADEVANALGDADVHVIDIADNNAGDDVPVVIRLGTLESFVERSNLVQRLTNREITESQFRSIAQQKHRRK